MLVRNHVHDAIHVFQRHDMVLTKVLTVDGKAGHTTRVAAFRSVCTLQRDPTSAPRATWSTRVDTTLSLKWKILDEFFSLYSCTMRCRFIQPFRFRNAFEGFIVGLFTTRLPAPWDGPPWREHGSRRVEIQTSASWCQPWTAGRRATAPCPPERPQRLRSQDGTQAACRPPSDSREGRAAPLHAWQQSHRQPAAAAR